MNQPDAKVAEKLWMRAHEAVRRGELARAVKDLAKAFEILKALKDPRLAQVHARWVDVHKMYKEEAAKGGARKAEAESKLKTIQAEAEAAANAGDLDKAIALYEQAVQQSPENELAKERLEELRQAKTRATNLSHPPQAAAPAAAAPVVEQAAPVVEQAAPVVEQAAPVVEQAAPVVEQAAPVVEQAAPVVEQAAPVVEQAAPVVEQAAPVVEQAASEPSLASAAAGHAPGSVEGKVAFLEALSARVQQRRKSA